MNPTLRKAFKRFWLVAMLFLLAGTQLVSAQNRKISGTVVDAQNNEPIVGANILVKGTLTGTVTDFDGKYSLTVPSGSTVILFSFVGYDSQEITLGASSVIDIRLASGKVLDEVVVIGYGVAKKEDLTGSVTQVTSKSFNEGAVNTPEQLIVGRVAGVQVTSAGGAPGGENKIRIRGGSSLTANNDPLIVIDGIPVDAGLSGSQNPLNTINPNDIESFTILKDASATAIYGSRASNGVIIITTKKGKTGPVQLSYSGDFNIAQSAKRLDPLTADEFRTLVNEIGTAQQIALLGDANTDWQDAIYQTATGTDHNLSAAGSIGDMLPYRVSLGFTNQAGILKTSNMDRYSGALSLSPKLLDEHLSINLNAKVSMVKNRFADVGTIGNAIIFDPTKPVTTGSDAFGGYFEWLNADGEPSVLAPKNPLARLEQREDLSTVNRFIGNAQFDYKFHFLPELRANLNVGMDRGSSDGTVTVPVNAASEFYNGEGGMDNAYFETKTNRLLDFYLNYGKTVNSIKSKFDVTAGYSYQGFHVENEFLTRDVSGSRNDTVDYEGEYVLISFFGRLNYTLNDRYLLTVTLRNDGSSRFSEDNRWGLFPSVAFAWNVARESFLADSKVLTDLKLRVGYGVTGQQDIIGYYPYLPRYTSGLDNAQYQFGDQFINTLRPEGYDANIKWEETTTWNAGIDFGFLNSRIYGTLDLYQRKTKDLLNQISIPAGTNLTNQLVTNIGNMENKGVEFSINATAVKKNDVTWDLGFNITGQHTEITNLTLNDDPTFIGNPTGGISGGVGNNIQIHSVGYAPSSFFVYKQVYDASGKPVQGLYEDLNSDGKITELDKYRYNKPAADVFLGFNTMLRYKNFDLSTVIRGNFNNYVYNNINSDKGIKLVGNSLEFVNNTLNTALEDGFLKNEYFSDHYIENASFMRVDNITLGYAFDKIVTNRFNGRVYATVQNVAVITNYTGLDPEVSNGIDNNIYPRPRTFLVGLNLNFK